MNVTVIWLPEPEIAAGLACTSAAAVTRINRSSVARTLQRSLDGHEKKVCRLIGAAANMAAMWRKGEAHVDSRQAGSVRGASRQRLALHPADGGAARGLPAVQASLDHCTEPRAAAAAAAALLVGLKHLRGRPRRT